MERNNLFRKIPVSVIIPCYNSKYVISRALISVLNQTYYPAEVIVIDDGSTEKGLDEEIKKFDNYFKSIGINFIFIKNKFNRGPGYTRNVGWEITSQPYIAFLDADDAWHSQKLERQLKWMLSHSNVVLTAHAYRIGENINYFENSPKFIKINPYSLLFKNFIFTSTVILKRDLPFRFSVKKYSEDYYLWLKIAFSGYIMYYLAEPLTFVYKAPWGEKGLSSRIWCMELGELDTYTQLFKEGLLPFYLYPSIIIWSLIKFLRRFLLKTLRSLNK